MGDVRCCLVGPSLDLSVKGPARVSKELEAEAGDGEPEGSSSAAEWLPAGAAAEGCLPPQGFDPAKAGDSVSGKPDAERSAVLYRAERFTKARKGPQSCSAYRQM